MKEKRYSIAQIQKIVGISPNELNKLLKCNAKRLKLTVIRNSDGSKETFLDEESFRKLLFIKQLEKGLHFSIDEICELVKEKIPGQEDEKEQAAKDPYGFFDRSLDAFESEVKLLRTQLTRLMIKYDHCLKELNISRSRNQCLENELRNLRNREAALMVQIRKDSTEFPPEEICEMELN
ncbi:MAG: hypothetical protein Kow0029_18770 [Candidatus Rifleibacteriota bacterium]